MQKKSAIKKNLYLTIGHLQLIKRNRIMKNNNDDNDINDT